jgi:hypothetical protein
MAMTVVGGHHAARTRSRRQSSDLDQHVAGDVSLASCASARYVIRALTPGCGHEPQSFLVQNQKLIDKAGREYPAADMAADSLNQQTTILNMSPGLTLKVRMRFDVPMSAKLTSVKLHGSASSAGATVSLW